MRSELWEVELSSSAGKRVIVTGAGGGLGLAMAKAFADEGATVGMLDVNKASA